MKNSILKISLFIAVVFGLFGCKTNNDKEIDQIPFPSMDNMEGRETRFRIDPADLCEPETYVSFIANINEVQSAGIGVALANSEVYDSFEGLYQVANINDLYPLLEHDSVAVRVYAYLAIVLKDSTLRESAWGKMKGKKELVRTFFACKRDEKPVDIVINDWIVY
ncbi:hypothetical protein LS482_10975 [Sinomicrobium kalidii]|uniref:hypothetical protein n=1 Tax=Sinomicrobium kalidii TaxID=2900738 RepID=UPI001E598149|nr:hypothetical protein [Sinomicrobium kalidii]UGU14235.1 hypothetical protein LS482_10975 [Sinomicrobium kalidii]